MHSIDKNDSKDINYTKKMHVAPLNFVLKKWTK